MTPLVERPYRHRQVGRDVPNSPQWVENRPSQQPLMIRQGDHRPIRVESHAEGQARVLRGPQVRTLSPPAVPYQRCSVLEEWPRDYAQPVRARPRCRYPAGARSARRLHRARPGCRAGPGRPRSRCGEDPTLPGMGCRWSTRPQRFSAADWLPASTVDRSAFRG